MKQKLSIRCRWWTL